MSDEELDALGGPLRHLQRMAPPWSAQRRTVCGRDLDDVGKWITWEEARALANKHGRARLQFLMCQTCLGMHQYRAERPGRWEEDPAAVVGDWAGRSNWRQTADGDQTRAELWALSRLVENHREEFDALVAGSGANELQERRRAKRRRR